MSWNKKNIFNVFISLKAKDYEYWQYFKFACIYIKKKSYFVDSWLRVYYCI